MHIPPVHNRCALDFVIGGFCGKYTVSLADSKLSNLAHPLDANFEPPLYTRRAAVDPTPLPTRKPRSIRKQP
jgi:hypothetical protein